MDLNSCLGAKTEEAGNEDFEVARIEKITKVCPMCEDYAGRMRTRPVVVMCCEGACLRGEVARQAANILCHSLQPDKTARVCLGGAFTKDTGQRNLVRGAPRLIAIEGCFIKCATRMMQGVLDSIEPEVILADQLYEFDRNLFGIDEMDEAEIRRHALDVAGKISATF
ncbi:DGC domain containing protein [Desulfocurvibacter africanus PCS]|uniref:DGC domain containing protein n=1 Tax=Desulfocurvibacter africanus PCS TaxID=1262666 RepID=M5PTP8_DESAF|nr:putative zinc-binding protein [Desulfocurvibacter africanus]EMG37454.1 DGC domain containing protein [Desulfocurvibacter africanus PCS]